METVFSTRVLVQDDVAGRVAQLQEENSFKNTDSEQWSLVETWRNVSTSAVTTQTGGSIKAKMNLPARSVIGEALGIVIDKGFYRDRVLLNGNKWLLGIDYSTKYELVLILTGLNTAFSTLKQSCTPNIGLSILLDRKSLPHIFFVALDDIVAGSELTLNFCEEDCNTGLHLTGYCVSCAKDTSPTVNWISTSIRHEVAESTMGGVIGNEKESVDRHTRSDDINCGKGFARIVLERLNVPLCTTTEDDYIIEYKYKAGG